MGSVGRTASNCCCGWNGCLHCTGFGRCRLHSSADSGNAAACLHTDDHLFPIWCNLGKRTRIFPCRCRQRNDSLRNSGSLCNWTGSGAICPRSTLYVYFRTVLSLRSDWCTQCQPWLLCTSLSAALYRCKKSTGSRTLSERPLSVTPLSATLCRWHCFSENRGQNEKRVLRSHHCFGIQESSGCILC